MVLGQCAEQHADVLAGQREHEAAIAECGIRPPQRKIGEALAAHGVRIPIAAAAVAQRIGIVEVEAGIQIGRRDALRGRSVG